MKFLPGTDPALIQKELDKWEKDIKVAPIKADTLQGDGIKNLAIKKPQQAPKAYTTVDQSTLTDWSPNNQSGADLWDEVKGSIQDQPFNTTRPQIPTLENTKSFIPGANATGVRMARSNASRTGAGLTGTDQFKQQRTGEGLTPREPRQGLNLDTPPQFYGRGPDQQIPNTGVGTGERWSGRGPENIQAEADMIAKKKAMEASLLAIKKQQNLLINKR